MPLASVYRGGHLARCRADASARPRNRPPTERACQPRVSIRTKPYSLPQTDLTCQDDQVYELTTRPLATSRPTSRLIDCYFSAWVSAVGTTVRQGGRALEFNGTSEHERPMASAVTPFAITPVSFSLKRRHAWNDVISREELSMILTLDANVLTWFGQRYDHNFIIRRLEHLIWSRVKAINNGAEAASEAQHILSSGKKKSLKKILAIHQDVTVRARITGSLEEFTLAESLLKYAAERDKEDQYAQARLQILLSAAYLARADFEPDRVLWHLCSIAARRAETLFGLEDMSGPYINEGRVAISAFASLSQAAAYNSYLRFSQPAKILSTVQDLLAYVRELRPYMGKSVNTIDGALPMQQSLLAAARFAKESDPEYLDEAIARASEAYQIGAQLGTSDSLTDAALVKAEHLWKRLRLRANAGDMKAADADYSELIGTLDLAMLHCAPGSSRNLEILGRYAEIGSQTSPYEGFAKIAEMIWINCCEQVPTADALLKLRLALAWAQHLEGRNPPSNAENVYRIALSAWRDLIDRQVLESDKESWLIFARGLPAWAAYAFAESGDVNGAVEVADAGRARLLTSAIDEADIARLRSIAGDELAEALTMAGQEHRDAEEAFVAIDRRAGSAEESPEAHWQALGSAAQRVHASTINRDGLIQTIRALEGLSDFPAWPQFSQLSAAAGVHPLVYVVPGRSGGSLLIVSPGVSEAERVPLRELRWDVVYSQVAEYIHTYRRRHESARAWVQWADTLTDTCEWLWHTIMGTIVEVLKGYSFARLVPYGPLGLVPLHAAYTVSEGTSVSCALDYMAFSYVPSGRLLAGKHTKNRSSSWNALIVNNPAAEGEDPLIFGAIEVEAVRDAFPQVRELYGEEATLHKFVNLLPQHNLVHLSAHGYANGSLPRLSGIRFAGSDILTADRLKGLHLSRLELIVLSSCESAFAGGLAFDESINFPTAFFASAQCNVIGSLWVSQQEATSMLFDYFYQTWQQEHETESMAEALRRSQIYLRDAGVSRGGQRFDHPAYWAPFALYG